MAPGWQWQVNVRKAQEQTASVLQGRRMCRQVLPISFKIVFHTYSRTFFRRDYMLVCGPQFRATQS